MSRVRIPISEYNERIKKCQKWMYKEGFEAVLAYSDLRWAMMSSESGGNARYYVGFSYHHSNIREKGVYLPYLKRDSIVFIPREGEPALITPLYFAVEQIKKESWMKDVRSVHKRFQRFPQDKFAAFTEKISELLGEKGLNDQGKIGIGGMNTPMELWVELKRGFPESHLINITSELGELRSVKSNNELKLMRKAADINNATLETIIEVCKPGISEWEIHQAMEETMFRNGADYAWTVVRSGPRSWIRMCLPDITQRILREGDMVTIDYGCEYAGYHSDTNYAMIIGRGKKDQKGILKTVIKMINSMLSATRAGTSDLKLVEAGMNAVKNSKYREYVGTNFGHAYGCGGEMPDLEAEYFPFKEKKNTIIIKKNMVFCYEPAIYMPNVGGACLEDEIIVTKDGYELLTYNTQRAMEALN